MKQIVECKPNEILAVDPNVLIDYDQLNTFMKEFGFKKAKFIAIIPDNWIHHVTENILQEVDARTNGDPFEKNAYISALSRLFDSQYSKCEKFYELIPNQAEILKRAATSVGSPIEIARQNKIVNIVISESRSDASIRFQDLRMNLLEFSQTEEVKIREVNAQLNDPGSVVNQQISLFERIIDYNDEVSLMDRYLQIKLDKNSKVDLSTPHSKLLDKLFKKIAEYAESRKTNKILNIYLDQESGNKGNNPIYHSKEDLDIIKNYWLTRYKSLFVKGLIIRVYPFKPIKQDTHDRWVIGHLAGGWGCLRGAKDTYTDELNFYSITADTRLKTLSDYNIDNGRIVLDFGLLGPIEVSVKK